MTAQPSSFASETLTGIPYLVIATAGMEVVVVMAVVVLGVSAVVLGVSAVVLGVSAVVLGASTVALVVVSVDVVVSATLVGAAEAPNPVVGGI